MAETRKERIARDSQEKGSGRHFTPWIGLTDEKARKDTAMVVAIWSIVKGVGKEIHFLTAAFCTIMDRTESGARIGWIKDIVEEHLLKILPGDLVVVKRG